MLVVAIAVLAVTVFVVFRDDGTGPTGSTDSSPEVADVDARPPADADTATVDPERPVPDEVRTGVVDTAAPVDFAALDPHLDLRGVVLAPNDSPIAGARVVAISHPWRRASVLNTDGYAVDVEGPETRSSVDGTFSLRLPRGSMVALRVEAKGFSAETVADCQAGEHVTVRVVLAGTLLVLCRDDGDEPVTDAAVELLWSGYYGSSHGRRVGHTDDDGKCVLEDVRPGGVTVKIEPRDLGNSWNYVTIVESDVTTLEVTLASGREIEGTVTDAKTGSPIAGARVGKNTSMYRPVETDSDGRYVFKGWVDGVRLSQDQDSRIHIHVTAGGYGRQDKNVPASGPLDFTLVPGDAARGRVVSAAGDPVANAMITAAAGDTPRSQRIDNVSTESRADGTFELMSLRRDLSHTLVVAAPGHGRLLLDFDPHAPDAGVIEFGDVALFEARRIEGRAIGPDGAPRANVGVTLDGCNADRGRLRAPKPPLNFHFSAKTERRRTDDQGRFRFPDLAPGEYRLTMHIEDAPDVTETVRLAADQDMLDVTLRHGGGHTLVVQVVDEHGAPAPGFSTNLRMPGGRERIYHVTADDGTAAFDGLPPGTVHVRVRANHPYIEPDPVEVDTAAGHIVVAVFLRAVVAGKVVDASGAPLESLEVRAERGEFLEVDRTDAEGRFKITVPSGQLIDLVVNSRRRRARNRDAHTASASGPMNVSTSVRLGQVPLFEPTLYRARLDGVLPPYENLVLVARETAYDGVIKVRVVDPKGAPIEGALVFLHSESPVRWVHTDAGGHAEFTELAPEPVHVYATGPNPSEVLYRGSRVAEVTPDAPESELRLRRGAWIQGRVLDMAGLPVAWAELNVEEEGSEHRMSLRTDEGGRFAFLIATTGRWFLDGESIERREITPNDGDLEIRLE